MKICIVNGQNHKGSTYHIGKMIANELAKENEITEFFLPRDLNHFCLGCYQCVEDETKCPFWNEKSIIINALKDADLFIFTSPNYCLGPSAPMKSFLDLMFDCWMVHKPKEWMFTKRAVVLSTSAGASSKPVIKMIKDSLFYWGVPEIKSYSIPVAAKNWQEVNEKKRAKITKNVNKLVKSLNTTKPPKVGFKTKFIFNMMGKTHTKGWDSSPTEKIYWDERQWLGKNRPWKH